MQSDWKEIYKLTSERTQESEQKYKDIGNFVFARLYSHLRRPTYLIVKLKGVGTWHLRRRRMQIIIDEYPPKYDPKFDLEPTDIFSKLEILKYENRKEIYELFTERLKEYEEYIQIRNAIRKIRYKTQPLIKPLEDDDN